MPLLKRATPAPPRHRMRQARLVGGIGGLGLAFALVFGWLAAADWVFGQTVVLTPDTVALHARQPLGQTFVAPADGLHRIDLLFSTRFRRRPGSFELVLRDEDGQALTALTLDTTEWREGWRSFEFEPLTGIAGRQLRLEFTRDAHSSVSLGLWVGPGSAYAEGEGIFRRRLDPSFDLAFRAYLATPPRPQDHLERLGDLATRLTSGRPGPFGQPSWVFLLGGLYAFGLGGLAWRLGRLVGTHR